MTGCGRENYTRSHTDGQHNADTHTLHSLFDTLSTGGCVLLRAQVVDVRTHEVVDLLALFRLTPKHTHVKHGQTVSTLDHKPTTPNDYSEPPSLKHPRRSVPHCCPGARGSACPKGRT